MQVKIIDGVEYISIPDLKLWLLAAENSFMKEGLMKEANAIYEVVGIIDKSISKIVDEKKECSNWGDCVGCTDFSCEHKTNPKIDPRAWIYEQDNE